MKTEHTPILTYKAFEMTDRPGFIDLSVDWDALPFDYKNKLIEACRQCVINGVLHEYLAVGAEALYLLDTAVA